MDKGLWVGVAGAGVAMAGIGLPMLGITSRTAGLILVVVGLAGFVSPFVAWAISRVFGRKVRIPNRVIRECRQLADDIAAFVVDRDRGGPRLPRSGETWEEDTNALVRYSMETQQVFAQRFGDRVVAMHDELQEHGYSHPELDGLYQHPTNLIGMRMLAARLGAIARRAEVDD